MMRYFLLSLIPLLGVMTGVLIVRLGFCWAVGEMQKPAVADSLHQLILREFNPQKMIVEGVTSLDFRNKFNAMVDQLLDKLVEAIKKQIPMAAMFLSETLVEKLKDIARDEVVKMVPQIEEKIVEGLQKHDVEALIAKKIEQIDWLKVKDLARPLLWRATLAAGLFGGGVGLLQLLIARASC